MLMMIEAPISRTAKQASPGRPLSLEESRDRLKHLVKGEVNGLGQEQEIITGEKKEHDAAYQSGQQESVGRGEEEEKQSPVGEVSLSTAPTQQDIGIIKQDDDGDDEMSEEEQERALKKAPLREAIKWLAAWLRRKKKKLGFGR
ncbi:hypothetical protein KJ596_02995 [Patescibacteria group bacterium]|nr:hypothetical protein [Patescibacteria group bacterium]MBU1868351.1 hypothetical protein [Patescibacteria group bacterium]